MDNLATYDKSGERQRRLKHLTVPGSQQATWNKDQESFNRRYRDQVARAPMNLYDPLTDGSIRLLWIVGKTESGLLQCYIAAWPLALETSYYAVSYAWGRAEQPWFKMASTAPTERTNDTVEVNGHAVTVSENLYDLLHEFYDSTPGNCRWWIDAICINQRDVAERTAQVNQMDRIYGSATRVVVWLGRGEERILRVLQIVRILARAYEKYGKSGSGLPIKVSDPLDPQQRDAFASLGLGDVQSVEWLALIVLYQRRWFLRVWTVQEVALARQCLVRIGKYEIDWVSLITAAMFLTATAIGDTLIDRTQRHFGREDVYLVASRFSVFHDIVRGHASRLNRMAQMWHAKDTVYASNAALMEMLISTLQLSAATDPRDRVFALLGILSRVSNEHVKRPFSVVADYGKNTACVYTEAMVLILKEAGTLTTLTRVPPPRCRNIEDLPSWVNDFSAPRPIQLLESSPRMPDATMGCKMGFTLSQRYLTVHAHGIGKVTHIGDDWNTWAYKHTFEGTARLILASGARPAKLPRRIRHLWRTMLCGLQNSGSGVEDEEILRLASRAQLLLVGVLAVLAGCRLGVPRSETLAVTVQQEQLAQLDSTGTIPSRSEVEALCDRYGISEHGAATTPDFSALTQDMQPFFRVVKRTMYLRRPFLLSNGMMGLGPIDVQVNDALCVVADGVRTPMLLGPTRTTDPESVDGVPCCMLLGEAYVPNIMYGEAVEQMQTDGKTWSKICIV